MITPLPLITGDKIGLVAPSRKVSSINFDGIVNFLNKWGFEVVLAKNIFAENNQFAGKDEERASDFMQMIEDTSVKAIFCSRGGYGTIRILEKLNINIIKENPKWIIGYSDITALHSYFHEIIGMKTIHATMPVNFNLELSESDSWKKLCDILNGKILSYIIQSNSLNREGITTGVLIGGNLSVLYSMRGTPYDLHTEGKILFLEDVDEYLYHIDRMMMNLKLSGMLKGLKGIIIGGMTDLRDNTIPFGLSAYEIIASSVREYNYPVVFGFPAGHCEPNLPLIFGKEIQLDVGKDVVKVAYFD